ncbi:MAG: protein kinase [Myxococcales bacterium]|nr:protein kinase [Myxococcales bacterium]
MMDDNEGLERTLAALVADRTLPVDLPHGATIRPRLAASSATLPPTDAAGAKALEELPAITLGGEGGAGSTRGTADLEIIERIGTGGMGVVELARQRSLGREVAIKRPRAAAAPSANANASDVSRRSDTALVREGVITGRLEHPAIVPVHALGRDHAGRPLLVMKRISGTSWRALIRDSDHPAWQQHGGDRLEFHLEVLLRVCDAVRFAHSRGVLHRDIKTDNVMIGSFGEVYLLDWGIGIELDDDGHARDDELVGTAGYLAPEMVPAEITGENGGARAPLSVRTDVFLLGATLHELLTGAMRHRGGNLLATLCAAYRCAPVDYDVSVPPELAAIANRATTRDPKQRHASVDELKRAIERFLERRSALALVDAAAERLAQLRAAVESAEHLRAGTGAGAGAAREIDRDGLRHVYDLAAECRFALRSALQTWPELPAAIELLEQCKRILVQVELDQDNINAAELLLSELRDDAPQLRARLEHARARRADEAQAQAKLVSLERDHDERVGSQRRGRMLAAGALVIVGTALLGTWLSQMAGLSRKAIGLVTTSAFTVVACGTLFALRARVFDTALNRRLAGVFVAGCLGLCAVWLVVLLLPVNHETAAVIHMLVLGLLYIACAIALNRHLFYGALPCAAGLVVAMIWPRLAVGSLTVANTLSVALVGLLWVRAEGES